MFRQSSTVIVVVVGSLAVAAAVEPTATTQQITNSIGMKLTRPFGRVHDGQQGVSFVSRIQIGSRSTAAGLNAG